MAHQNKASSVFDLLREYDVELSPQVQLILEKLKFNSVRTISMINIEKLEHLELDVRSLFASDEELLKMTQEDRVALFGESLLINSNNLNYLPVRNAQFMQQ
jgi:hypothetical protein